MRRVALVLVVGAAGCGGSVDRVDTIASGAGGAGAGAIGNGGFPGDGGPSASGGHGAAGADGAGGKPYVDPGCPPARQVPGPMLCDPLSQTGCAYGERCIPFVRYVEGCSTEEVGTACAAAGTGVQGDDCANVDCAPGFVCVSSDVGLKCARLCRGVGPLDDCEQGLVCFELDANGYYVCG